MGQSSGQAGAARSVSQLKQFEKCPQAWYRARVLRAWQKPAAWLPQGSAVHGAIEWYERTNRTGSLEEMLIVFAKLYAEEVASYTKITPNFEWWQASGRYTADIDLPRRYKKGVEQCKAYIDYYNRVPNEVIWIAPDGTPGIELSFEIDLEGVPVRGFIDAVISRPKGIWEGETEPIVRDAKTGNDPGDDFQLAVYALALRMQYGLDVWLGDYWMGRSGKPTAAYDLRDWPAERLIAKFHELEAAIVSGDFPALPDPDKCKFCDVGYGCPYSEA